MQGYRREPHLPRTLQEQIDDIIYESLRANDWNRSFAARDLSVHVRTIRNYIARFKKMGKFIGGDKKGVPVEEPKEFKVIPWQQDYCPKTGKKISGPPVELFCENCGNRYITTRKETKCAICRRMYGEGKRWG